MAIDGNSRRQLMTVFFALGVPASALACPVCVGETGMAVRAGIFDGQTLSTLASLFAPFPILLAIVALLRFGWPQASCVRRWFAPSGQEMLQ